MSRLGLEGKTIARARQAARTIADDVARVVAPRTTVSIERTVLRLLGVDGVRAQDDAPLPNVVVDKVSRSGRLGGGVFRPIAAAMIATGRSPQEIATGLATHELRLDHEADDTAIFKLVLFHDCHKGSTSCDGC
mgnify:CR=1 FL=1